MTDRGALASRRACASNPIHPPGTCYSYSCTHPLQPLHIPAGGIKPYLTQTHTISHWSVHILATRCLTLSPYYHWSILCSDLIILTLSYLFFVYQLWPSKYVIKTGHIARLLLDNFQNSDIMRCLDKLCISFCLH